MNLFPLVQRLQDMEVGVMGKSLFINMIPADAPQGVLLRTPLSGTPINYELPGFYRSEFKIIARAGNYETADTLITKAIEALTIGHGERVGDYVYRFCRPVAHPSAYPLSKGNLIEFSTDFDVAFHVYREPVEPEPPTETEGEPSGTSEADPIEDPSAEHDPAGETPEDQGADGQGDAADSAPEPGADNDQPVDAEPVEQEPAQDDSVIGDSNGS